MDYLNFVLKKSRKIVQYHGPRNTPWSKRAWGRNRCQNLERVAIWNASPERSLTFRGDKQPHRKT